MNEFIKTLLFVIAAVAAVSAAIVGRPGQVGVEVPDQIGKPLFEDFTDAAAAQRMEVAEFDEMTGDVVEFEVAKKRGVWVIPSHQDYPADATDRLQGVATMFIGMNVLNVAGDQNKDHATFGVVEPDPEKVSASEEGVGRMIKLEDSKGKRLAELIVGKEVKGQEGQRYVRIPRQDRVYIVTVDPEKLSTRFADWMQADVLDLKAMDVAGIDISDYSVNPVMTPDGRLSVQQEERSQLKVAWNADDFKWDLVELREFRNGQMRPTQLLDDEELDKACLDELKDSLAEFRIVDVTAKPEALRQNLKEGRDGIWTDREAVTSLFQRGFYPVPDGDQIGIVSSDGEVKVVTKESVKYTFRFGQIAGAESEGDENKLNRYVMITAAVDDESIPRPELEDLPPDDAASGETTEGSSDQVVDADEATAGSDDEQSETAEQADDQAELDAERDRITKDNQRKLDDYNEKRKKAQDKVNALNFRFADWYYVVSEDVYQKIHVGRADVISTKESSVDEGFGIDAFRKLEEEGLTRDEDQEE